MKNILKIFIGDVKHITKNTIALIIILGLAVIPSLYAWFNISASWDPYGNTGNLKVAVANCDMGYDGDLIPISVNVGDIVVSSLRDNKQIGWSFTDKQDAINGVNEGKYYAAIVLPESFSNDMLSFFSNDAKKTKIKYYLNEKQNAIASKITDKGANAVEKEISEEFVKTIVEVAVNISQDLSGEIDDERVEELIGNFASKLKNTSKNIKNSAYLLDSYADIITSLKGIINTSEQLVKDSEETINDGIDMLDDAQKDIDTSNAILDETVKTLDSMLLELEKSSDKLSEKTDYAIKEMNLDVDSTQKSLMNIANYCHTTAEKLTDIKTEIINIKNSTPAQLENVISTLNLFINNVDDLVKIYEDTSKELTNVANTVDKTRDNIVVCRNKIHKVITNLRKQIKELQSDYQNNVKPTLNDLIKNLKVTIASSTDMLNELNETSDIILDLSKSSTKEISKVSKSIRETSKDLKTQSKKLLRLSNKIEKARDIGDREALEKIFSESSDTISNFVSAPVELKETKFYKVENYGSAMAPFYTTLSIWFGAIALVAMMKTSLEEKRKRNLQNLKDYQLYFGRAILFVVMAILQTLIICVGNLFYLRIQCLHPWYFILIACFSAFVYSMIMYSLTISFGDIGKAICVILLVIQVAGSGGTFPIEMTPKFFQSIYKLLPFTHTMTAMREAICGFYKNTYWLSMSYLLVYLAIALLLGLVLRKPIIKLNLMLEEKLEETKLM